MIVRSVTVSGWRCFVDELTIGPLHERLNVISAPNGTGKTTIFEALRRAFFDGHKSTGMDVEALRPWGRLLTPRVSVEFSSKGTDYRISKSFLDSPKSFLERKEGSIFKKLAEGAQADNEVRLLLVQDPQSKKFSKPENWGLAQVLWAPQGSLQVGNLSGALVADIRSALSQQVTGAGAFDRKIQERYDRYFTPTGRLKSGKIAPEISRVENDLSNLRNQHEEWRERYEELEEISQRAAELRYSSAALFEEAQVLEKLVAEREKAANDYEKQLSEKNNRQLQCDRLEAQYQSFNQRISLIIETDNEIKTIKGLIEQVDRDLPDKKEEAEKARRKVAEISEALQAARNKKKELDTLRLRARLANDFVQSREDLAHINKKVSDIEQIEAALKQLNEERSSIIAPSQTDLASIRKCINDRNAAKLKIDAALISLEVTPETDGTLDVVAGENVGVVSLRSKESTTVKGAPEVVAILPGIARLRASGPTGSLEQNRDALARALSQLNHLTTPYGTTDIDELEDLWNRAQKLDEKVNSKNVQLAAVLGEVSLSDLRGQRDALSGKISSIVTENPDWVQSPPDPSALEDANRELEKEIESSIFTREQEAEESKDKLRSADAQVEKFESTKVEKSESLSELQKKLEAQTADGKRMDERTQELNRTAIEWEAARTGLREAEKSLEKLGKDPSEELEQLRSKLGDIKSRADAAREQAATQNGMLASRAEMAPYSKLADIEEKISALETRQREEWLRINSIKMLKDVVDQCRQEALEAVTVPVENRATEIFKTISDDRLGHVTLDEHFQPVGVLPTITKEQVSLDNLSGGELEQIYLATRLALVETLKKDDRQVVILDDILTATDSVRIDKVMKVFEQASKDLQIVVLTCHPERYQTLKTGKTFDLETLFSRSQ